MLSGGTTVSSSEPLVRAQALTCQGTEIATAEGSWHPLTSHCPLLQGTCLPQGHPSPQPPGCVPTQGPALGQDLETKAQPLCPHLGPL